jgi:hypothetical protein
MGPDERTDERTDATKPPPHKSIETLLPRKQGHHQAEVSIRTGPNLAASFALVKNKTQSESRYLYIRAAVAALSLDAETTEF